MGTTENLRKMVDRAENERLLGAIYSFLNQRENSEESRMWNPLTEEQKKEVIQGKVPMCSLETGEYEGF